ncbi:hypothetical protein [Streptomyces sasae]|uniref:hypothetical protein n=1 Tax=Streptomyces sasae TaxID=1266772 RepID=UPI002930A23C|nr:hypothetical protein [Streptomyces sasae]
MALPRGLLEPSRSLLLKRRITADRSSLAPGEVTRHHFRFNGHVLDVDLAALRREVRPSREYALNTPTA